MLFLFGRSVPASLSRYFSDRAAQDGHRVIFASLGGFPSSEAYSELRDIPLADIKNQPVVVFQSIAAADDFSANDYFTQLLWVGDTLKRYGAGPLWAITPFGPYTRQDQERTGKMDSVGCNAAAKHLALDFTGISTVEIHSVKAEALLKDHFGENCVFSINPTDIFVQDLQSFSLQNPVVVSPDKGANARADAMAHELNADRFYVDKVRREIVNTSIAGSRGNVAGCDAILVDDMADTLGTVENSARLVREQGASRVFVYAAHPVLSKPAWDRIARLIQDGIVDHVRFGNTIDRDEEYQAFAQEYGSQIADKVRFLSVEEALYQHIQDNIAAHPAMQADI
ncbi:MAG: ribose-phosphate diphosphokinase [Alphaproteobacteria bacterium]|nr:ribose-phosphate diphosphokinase [Alphaproteobacteria bacterium]